MHSITITKRIKNAIAIPMGRPMEPGVTYYATNAFVGSIMMQRAMMELDNGDMEPLGQHVTVKPEDKVIVNPFSSEESVLIIRGGGYGDLLLMTPLIRHLQSEGKKVTVACGDEYRDLFIGLDVETELLPVPLKDVRCKYDMVVAFEEWIEGKENAKTVHMAQHFASGLGILLTDLRPSYAITDQESKCAAFRYPRKEGIRRVGIQVMASAWIRTYPKAPELMAALSAEGYEIFLFGKPGEFKLAEEKENILNLCEKGLTFRESAAAMATCDAIIAPDSALFHLAGALNIPAIGLYGPFPSNIRATSDCQHPIDGKAPCSPCFFHAVHRMARPEGMPCTEKGWCAALTAISPEAIVKKLDSILRKA